MPPDRAKRNEQLARIAQKLDGRAADDIVHLAPKDARFVESIVERWEHGRFEFSDAQAQWLEDLEERYL